MHIADRVFCLTLFIPREKKNQKIITTELAVRNTIITEHCTRRRQIFTIFHLAEIIVEKKYQIFKRFQTKRAPNTKFKYYNRYAYIYTVLIELKTLFIY